MRKKELHPPASIPASHLLIISFNANSDHYLVQMSLSQGVLELVRELQDFDTRVIINATRGNIFDSVPAC